MYFIDIKIILYPLREKRHNKRFKSDAGKIGDFNCFAQNKVVVYFHILGSKFCAA
jgi:hypothetical protein